ncbi:MAG: DUF1292 domain-containing protein [Firmicutes bacterium]|nr:DUF1292 domain-containing protein [Bacillota bacterium]
MENIDEKDVVILTDEEGLEHQFIIVDMVEVETGVYAMLMPMEIEGEDDDYYVIMKVIKEDDEEILMTIEDDDEYQAVAQAIEELYSEENEEDQEIIDSISDK